MMKGIGKMEQKIKPISKKLQTYTKNTVVNKRKSKKVRVYWRDAISHAIWLDPDEAIKFVPAINVTEGYLLCKNKDSCIVFMSYNDTDIGDTTVIPTENIQSLKFVR